MDEAEQLADAIKGRTLLIAGRLLEMDIGYQHHLLTITLTFQPDQNSIMDIVNAIQQAKTVKLYAVEQNVE